MTWRELEFATKLLIPRISTFNPELVVGVGIGGTIWGAILAGNLNDTPFVAVDRIVTWADGSRTTRAFDPNVLRPEVVRGKRVLVVNGELVSGGTTRAILDILDGLDVASYEIAFIDEHYGANPRADHKYLSTNVFIQKPWRFHSTYTNPDDNPRPA